MMHKEHTHKVCQVLGPCITIIGFLVALNTIVLAVILVLLGAVTNYVGYIRPIEQTHTTPNNTL